MTTLFSVSSVQRASVYCEEAASEPPPTSRYIPSGYRKSVLSVIGILAALLPYPALAVGASSSATSVAAEPTALNILLLALFVLVAIGISFICSLAESALLSMTPSYIADVEESSPKKASMLRRLKVDNIDQSLAAILTLNTVAHTLGSIGAGAQATIVFGSAWFGLFSAFMTLAILFLSEIIPKTLGTMYWRQLSGVVAYFVRGRLLLLYTFFLI